MRPFVVLLAFTFPSAAADAERTLAVIPSKSLPAFSSVAIYRSADIKPGQMKPKPMKSIASEKGFTDAVKVVLGPDAVHVYAKPKDGVEVLVAENLTVKPGEEKELKLGNVFGVVEVFQKDGFAKVDRIVLTSPDDPGPDEKSHAAIQTGSDYRVEMPVPEGFYAVWLVPSNGARSTRIEERIRVLPGKIVRIGN